MTVTDSAIRNVHDGIYLEPSDSDSTHLAKVFVEHCRFENYFHGFVAAGRYTLATIRDSQFAGKSRDNLVTYGGIIAAPLSVGTTNIMVENCMVTNNYLAIGTKTDGVSFYQSFAERHLRKSTRSIRLLPE